MPEDRDSKLRAAFASVGQPAGDAGAPLEPAALVRRVFGADARYDVRTPGGGAPYWFDTDVVVHVDSAWHTATEVTSIARELGRLGVRCTLGRLDRSGTSEKYRVVIDLKLLRPPGPAPAPHRELGEGRGVFGDPPSIEVCSHCGAQHRVYTPRKPFPGAERNDEEFLCLACGRHVFHAHGWESVGFRVELVEDDVR